MHRLFDGKVLRDLPIFLQKISLTLVKWEKNLKAKCNLDKDLTKISHWKCTISHRFLAEWDIFSHDILSQNYSYEWKTVCILISWLHQKPADLDVHCFHKTKEGTEFEKSYGIMPIEQLLGILMHLQMQPRRLIG